MQNNFEVLKMLVVDYAAGGSRNNSTSSSLLTTTSASTPTDSPAISRHDKKEKKEKKEKKHRRHHGVSFADGTAAQPTTTTAVSTPTRPTSQTFSHPHVHQTGPWVPSVPDPSHSHALTHSPPLSTRRPHGKTTLAQSFSGFEKEKEKEHKQQVSTTSSSPQFFSTHSGDANSNYGALPAPIDDANDSNNNNNNHNNNNNNSSTTRTSYPSFSTSDPDNPYGGLPPPLPPSELQSTSSHQSNSQTNSPVLHRHPVVSNDNPYAGLPAHNPSSPTRALAVGPISTGTATKKNTVTTMINCDCWLLLRSYLLLTLAGLPTLTMSLFAISLLILCFFTADIYSGSDSDSDSSSDDDDDNAAATLSTSPPPATARATTTEFIKQGYLMKKGESKGSGWYVGLHNATVESDSDSCLCFRNKRWFSLNQDVLFYKANQKVCCSGSVIIFVARVVTDAYLYLLLHTGLERKGFNSANWIVPTCRC